MDYDEPNPWREPMHFWPVNFAEVMEEPSLHGGWRAFCSSRLEFEAGFSVASLEERSARVNGLMHALWEILPASIKNRLLGVLDLALPEFGPADLAAVHESFGLFYEEGVVVYRSWCHQFWTAFFYRMAAQPMDDVALRQIHLSLSPIIPPGSAIYSDMMVVLVVTVRDPHTGPRGVSGLCLWAHLCGVRIPEP